MPSSSPSARARRLGRPAPRGPAPLRLERFRVLLVGGGDATLAQLAAVLRNSPATAVTVVTAHPVPALEALAARHPRLRLLARPFAETDLDGHDFACLAPAPPDEAADRGLSRRVRAGAAARGWAPGPSPTGAEALYLAPAGAAGGSRPPHRLRALLEQEAPAGAKRGVLQQMAWVRSRLRGEFGQQLRALNRRAGALAYGPRQQAPAEAYWRRLATGALAAFAALLVANILSYYFTWPQVWGVLRNSGTFYTFAAVGFGAQLVDGLLGMGYGVVSAISLMSLGLSPTAVSASIHTAEMFASGASGYQHYRFGNVNKRLFRVLLVPGVLGSVAGAWLLAHYGERYAAWVKPLLAVYLLLLGARIMGRAFRRAGGRRQRVKNAGWLAGAGGFLDSFGGGGWGPLVTSTLIANGRTPQYVIGTVSLAEFFVTFASALTFFSALGISHWQIVLGLIAGGVAAAPLAARLAGRVPVRFMFLAVGLMVVFWSLWTLRKLFLA